ncbi:MAG TPA: 16S rRNA (cytosine(967)-C(5))-methyltransferase RsmB [Candidatus Binatia bacterium]|nr:16S rRNA (cytosine(967)-C(5))-methyltransferase RsmB [Candidatus Binatia bacterium]
MKVSPARAAAFDALLRVERDAAFATDALDAILRRSAAARDDAALATELTLGVLRWRGLLDFLIERCTSRSVETLDREVLLALRLGLYQLRYLSRVPASAAVNESVELVKRARKSSAAALVNAALRRAAADATLRDAAEGFVPPDYSVAERLALAGSHPRWLVERWLARFGAEEVRGLLEANNRPPRWTAAIQSPSMVETAVAELNQLGCQPAPGRWLASAVELHSLPRRGSGRGGATHAAGGAWWFLQDEASQMIPLLLDIRRGQYVLDLCAAPGGKTARLIQQRDAGPGGIIACDVHLHRLRQMRAFLTSVGAGAADYVALDGTRPLPFGTRFDRILVDAPCSGTGTLARNPEIRWRLKAEDLTALAEKQRALLLRGLEQLAPGGRLVYSTCSLEPEENEEVIAAALAAHPAARRVSGAEALAPHLRPGIEARALFDSRGDFRTLPRSHGTDGFFAAVLETRR